MSGLRDLVGGKPGSSNALSGLAHGTSDMAAQLQDVGMYQQHPQFADEKVSNGLPVDMMHAPPPPEMEVFAKSFQGPHSSPHAPPPVNFMRQHSAPSMAPQAMMQGDQLARDFERMSMQQQQQQQRADFERAFQQQQQQQQQPHMLRAQSAPMHAPSPWLAEFEKQQTQQRPAPPTSSSSQPQQHMHHHPQHRPMQYPMMMRPMGGYAPAPVMVRPPATMSVPPPTVMQQPPVSATSSTPVTTAATADPAVKDKEETQTPEQKQGADWAQDFVVEEQGPPPSAGGMGLDKEMVEQLLQSDDPKWRNSKFLKFLKKVNDGVIEFKDNELIDKSQQPASGDQDWADQFDASLEQPAVVQPSSQSLEDQAFQNPQEEMEQWLQNFQQQQQQWVEQFMAAQEQQTPAADPEYKFQKDNPYLNHPDPFAEGLRLMKDGELKQAILALEAAVQQNPDNAEAWRYLGQAQAENEAEEGAIAALLKAISIDPYNLEALMMLGVSYTNDLEEARALNYLKTWLEHNPDYQGTTIKAQHAAVKEYEDFYGGGSAASVVDHTLHEQVMNMFQEAIKMNPTDPELHTVIGVLYHISSDYPKAIEAFRNAVKLKPDDAQLWNKLGATLANAARSAEATECYTTALKLKPNYVRALANLAISYANQGQHQNAAQTYLQALIRNSDADHIWSYLRISLTHLGRESLVELTRRKNVELFRPYFQF